MLKPSYLKPLSSKAVANTYQSFPLSLGTLWYLFSVCSYLGYSWLYPLLYHSWLLVRKSVWVFYFISALISFLISQNCLGTCRSHDNERLYIISLSLLHVITSDSISFLCHLPWYSMSPNVSVPIHRHSRFWFGFKKQAEILLKESSEITKLFDSYFFTYMLCFYSW